MRAEFTERGTKITLRLRNDASRAIHYISSVRGLLFERASRRLLIRLANDEAAMIGGGAKMRPAFNYIDPGSDAELTLSLPPRIVTLSATPSVPGNVEIEEDRLADAREIVVEIAWADTPFYEDPRPEAEERNNVMLWAQGKARMSFTVPPDKPKPVLKPKPKRKPRPKAKG